MPGLSQANSFIAADEGQHTDFACLLYTKYIVNKLSDELVHEMMREAVAIESEFINSAIPCSLIGMNAPEMLQYIQFVTDRITIQLGHTPIYNVENPFNFMERAGVLEHVNFFEVRNTEYMRAATLPSITGKADDALCFGDDE